MLTSIMVKLRMTELLCRRKSLSVSFCLPFAHIKSWIVVLLSLDLLTNKHIANSLFLKLFLNS